MSCPACGARIAADAWICPACEHIVDPSVLGEGAVPDAEAFAERTRMVAWEGDPDDELPDAMILGDVTVDGEGFSVMPGAGAGPDGQTSTFLYYSAASPSRRVSPESVPQLGPRARAPGGTPYEAFVLSCVDGRRSVREIRRLSGLAVQEVVITLLTLLDREAVIISGLDARPGAAELSPVVPQPLDAKADEAATYLGELDPGDPDATVDGTLPPGFASPPSVAAEEFEEEEATAMVDLEELERRSAGASPRVLERAPREAATELPELSSDEIDELRPEPPLRPRLPTAVRAPAPLVDDGFDEDFGSLLVQRPELEDPRLAPAPSVPPRAPTAPPVLDPSALVLEEAPPEARPGRDEVRRPLARPIAERDARPGPRAARPAAAPPPSPRATPAPGAKPVEPRHPADPADRPSGSGEKVDPVRASKAAKLFEQALADKAAGNLVSARMNMKLALTFDPTNDIYGEAFKELASNPEAAPRPANPERTKARELYDAATEAENEGDYDEAVRLLEKAISVSKQAAFHNRLGVILAMKKHEFVRAQELIEKAIELSPGNGTYERNLQKVLSMAATHGLRSEKKAKRGGLLGLFGRRR